MRKRLDDEVHHDDRPRVLKRAGLVRTKRGARGGYWLAEDPATVSVADVIRAVEGPLANIQDLPPEETKYEGSAERLRDVWIAVRQNLREVLESVTLEELAAKRLPAAITSLLEDIRGEQAPSERYDPRKKGVREIGNPHPHTSRAHFRRKRR